MEPKGDDGEARQAGDGQNAPHASRQAAPHGTGSDGQAEEGSAGTPPAAAAFTDAIPATLPPREEADALTVVGVGASAGGIRALQEFFARAPEGSGLAYVVVLHLSPEHESHLAEVLARATPLPVVQVTDAVRVEPDHVYVIPPAKHLSLDDGLLRLGEMPHSQGRRVAIDRFFRSLAEAHGPQAAVVVLSGADADGTLGLKQVKEVGGLTIAQVPLEAEFDTMPRSAIATGMVDFVLPAAEIPAQIIAYRDASRRMHLPEEAAPSPEQRDERPEVESALGEILLQVREQTGHDFAQYKRATVLRRIGRRLQVHNLPDLPAYRDFLRRQTVEAGALLQDLLISVTQFFRDPPAWETLEREVIPRLFDGKGPEDEVRVWVCGCATGEEAYSLAILLLEQAAHRESPPRIQVFATDLDARAITAAREGTYPAAIAADVTPERLRRWFYRESGGYRIRKEVREAVLFVVHNVLRDPAFSRLDLVTCRNMLIYLDPAAQQRVLETFHFGLRPDGRLFLGSAESVEGASALFSLADKQHHLYMRQPLARPIVPPIPPVIAPITLPSRRPPLAPPQTSPASEEDPAAGAPGLSHPSRSQRSQHSPRSGHELHRSLLESYAPPSLVVDEQHRILHVSPGAARYLRYAAGEPTADLLRVIHPDLRLELSAALAAAAADGAERVASVRDALLPEDDSHRSSEGEDDGSSDGEMRPQRHHAVRITVRPVREPQEPQEPQRGYFLVFFEQLGAPESLWAPSETMDRMGAENTRLSSDLASVIQQYEALVEELKSSNEEQQSVNEELRATTEELETSKEEQQSVNEELATVNAELKSRVEEVSRSNSDLQNLLASTDIATLFLDRGLQIARYTPSAEALFNIIPADVGRPIAHFTHRLQYPELVEDAERVLVHLAAVEREVQSTDGRAFLTRLLPYRTLEDRIDGVVVTFVDITRRSRAEAERATAQEDLRASAEELRQSEERLRTLTDAVPQLIWANEAGGKADYFNQRWFDYSGLTYEESAGPGWQVIVHPDDAPASKERWQQALATGEVFDCEYRLLRHDGVYRWFIGRNVPLRDKDGQVQGWFGSATDIEDLKQAEAARHESDERFRLLVEGARDYAMFLQDREGRITFWSAGAERVFGWSEAEVVGQMSALIFTEEDRERGEPQKEMQAALAGGSALNQRWHLRKDGSRIWCDGLLTRLDSEGGEGERGFVKICRDATKERRAEEALRQAHDELESRVAERTAQLSAVSTERARLLQQVVRAQEEERARLSRELHDRFGQHLSGFLLGVDALRAQQVPGSDAAALAERLRQAAADLSQEVHRLAWDLRPPALDDMGLEAALSTYLREWQERHGTLVDFHSRGVDKERRLPSEVETAFYRIVQEALTNVARHAGARNVSIVLERLREQARLTIEDDGAGFDAEQVLAGSKRLGLRGMQERAALLGGTLEVESAPGGGTTLYIRVPLAPQAKSPEGVEGGEGTEVSSDG